MKLRYAHSFLLGCLAFALLAEVARAETPTEAVDRVWNSWDFEHGQLKDISDQEFRGLVKKIAHEQGVTVIAPIMIRSKDWKGEEGMIFVSLVALLPREQTVSVLQRYKKDGKPWEQQAAMDYLIEFDAPDVKEMVKKYSSQ